jgi:hypothetical protein
VDSRKQAEIPMMLLSHTGDVCSSYTHAAYRPIDGRRALFGLFDKESVMGLVSKQAAVCLGRPKNYINYWVFRGQDTKKLWRASLVA